jgi:hypothetical protein
MKKILILIIIFSTSVMAHNIKKELSNFVKRLNNCSVYTKDEALELGLSKDGRELHEHYSGAVYYSCHNGYFMYVQDIVKGSFIRGEVCKTGEYDIIDGCHKSDERIYFLLMTYKDTWEGRFIEIDRNGMRVKDFDIEKYTRDYGE